MCNHLYRLSSYWVNVTPEMMKPVQPAAAPEIGRDEQPDERDNEIVIELDRENQYGRTQPRANEPQGNHLRYTKFAHSDTLHADSILPSVFEVESPVLIIRAIPLQGNSPLIIFHLFPEIHFYVRIFNLCPVSYRCALYVWWSVIEFNRF